MDVASVTTGTAAEDFRRNPPREAERNVSHRRDETIHRISGSTG
jgi:hypothetical protein